MHLPRHRSRLRLQRQRCLGMLPLAALVCGLLSGCAALTNPVANGVPVRRLPPDLLAVPKEGTRHLPLTLLRQKPPTVYRLAAHDVLGIWIEGVLGERNQLPPIVNLTEAHNLPPAVGVPIDIRSDGTISLPYIAPLSLQGMSIEEAQQAIRTAYLKAQILKEGRERVLVTLLRRRVEQVLVFREDASGTSGVGTGAGTSAGTRSFGVTLAPGGTPASLRRGTGFAIDLPAYENDVLHALAQTGGLPGLDAVNEVVIQRGYFQDGTDRDTLLQELGTPPGGGNARTAAGAIRGEQTIRIPMRLRPGEVPSIRPEDIILHTGDILFIEAREAEYFYTGGILPPGQFVVPRDYDLDVVQAISLVGGPMVSGGLNPINLSGTFVQNGIGFPNPSLVFLDRSNATYSGDMLSCAPTADRSDFSDS